MDDVDLSDELMKILLEKSVDFFTLNYKNDASDLLLVLKVIKDATSGS